MPMLEQVRSFLPQLDGGPVLVAVSGGADSVALLRALAQFQPEGLVGPLHVAHLNHQLRGAESDADEQFVGALTANLRHQGVVLQAHCRSRDVAALASAAGENLERAARRLRYDWFVELARVQGICWVATGHTADDQAETVLHRLLRGSGLRGLAGIPPRRELAPGVEVIRPLLAVRREEVLTFLAELGQDFRQDSSNTDKRFTRNRLRHELLPLLARTYNPQVVDILSRLAEQAREVEQEQEQAAAELLGQVELPRAGTWVVLRSEPLQQSSPRRVAEMLRLLWRREDWPLGEMGRREWLRAVAVARGEAVAVDLPARMRLQSRQKVIQVGRLA